MSDHALIFDRFVVDWSAKCGCTSVLKMWFEHSGQLEEALKYNKWIHKYRTFKCGHMKYIPGKTKMHNAVHVKFVRNPYSRAVSSYIHCSRTGILGTRGLTFRQFLFNYIPKRGIGSNSHYRPQHMHHGISRYDHVIKIEHMEQGVKMLNEKYNITPPLNCAHDSAHHVTQKQHVPEAYDIKFKDFVHDHGPFTTPTYDSFYNQEIKQQVYKLYQQDVDLYKYSYEYE